MSAHRWDIDPDPELAVIAVGATNGLGFNAAHTWAFWRAEANGLQASPFRCPNGTRATMVLVRTYPPRLTGVERLVRLLDDTLPQVSGAVDALGADARVAVVLCLAAHLDDPVAPALRRVRARLEARVEAWRARHPGLSLERVVARGNASLAEALAHVGEALATGRADAGLVVSVDSGHDPDVVQGMILSERLFDGENVDACIPGEGAACLLVAGMDGAVRAGHPPLAFVACAATGEEPGSMFAPRACTGRGLAEALGAVAAEGAALRRPIAWMLGDLTNERHRTREYQLALPRAFAPGGLDDAGQSFQSRAAAEVAIDFLPLRFGDLGASTMTTAAVIAAESFARGDPTADHCAIFGVSVSSARGAVLLIAPEASRFERASAPPRPPR